MYHRRIEKKNEKRSVKRTIRTSGTESTKVAMRFERKYTKLERGGGNNAISKEKELFLFKNLNTYNVVF